MLGPSIIFYFLFVAIYNHNKIVCTRIVVIKLHFSILVIVLFRRLKCNCFSDFHVRRIISKQSHKPYHKPLTLCHWEGPQSLSQSLFSSRQLRGWRGKILSSLKYLTTARFISLFMNPHGISKASFLSGSHMLYLISF